MVGEGDPVYLKFWIKLTAMERNHRFSIYFRSQCLSRNTNRKSHMVPLVLTSMMLNSITALILRFFFTEFDSFAGQLCHSDGR